MAQNLGTLAVFLALMKTKLDFLHGGTEMGHWASEAPLDFAQINLTVNATASRVCVSGNAFPETPREPHFH